MFICWLTPKLGIMLCCSMNPYLSMESRVIALQQVDLQQTAKQPEGSHGLAFTVFYLTETCSEKISMILMSIEYVGCKITSRTQKFRTYLLL